MKLFDKRFVHFMWDDSLDDKEGFFADDAQALLVRVNSDYTNFYGKVCRSETLSYPFARGKDVDTLDVDTLDVAYRFFYYDPNYEVKKAYAEGKQVQYKALDTGRWCDWDNSQGCCPFHDDIEYRIKQEDPKTRRMTYRELAEWLAKGNGQATSGDVAVTQFRYDNIVEKDNSELPITYKIRRWGTDEWIEPTIDVFASDVLDEKEE